jgi:predicted DNA-binding transcriptional regulator AlpA
MADNKTISEKLLFTTADICRVLSIGRSSFFSLRSCGRIPLTPVRLGTKILFRKIEVEAWTAAGCPSQNWNWQDANNGR